MRLIRHKNGDSDKEYSKASQPFQREIRHLAMRTMKPLSYLGTSPIFFRLAVRGKMDRRVISVTSGKTDMSDFKGNIPDLY